MTFEIDKRITDSAKLLGKTKLCSVFLKNNNLFPWLILVPNRENLSQLCELSSDEWHNLGKDINTFSDWMKTFFEIQQLNVGNLGNIVKQLHIHIVGRNSYDPLWPHGVWQPEIPEKNYSPHQITKIKQSIASCF